MAEEETPTTTDVDPTPAEPEPTTPAAEPAPEPAPEAPPPPPWANVQGTDWEDLLDHEEFAPVLTKREERIKATLHQELGSQYQQGLKTAVDNWAGTQMAQTVAGYYGSIAQKLEGGDYEGAERLLDKLDAVGQPYLRLAEGVSKTQGGMELRDTIMGHLKAELIGHKEREAFEDDLKGPIGQSWPETIKAWKNRAIEGALAADKKKTDKLAMDAARAELAAKTRDAKGPAPGVPAGGGGGGAPVDPDSIPTNTWITLPMEQREEIKSRWAEYMINQLR